MRRRDARSALALAGVLLAIGLHASGCSSSMSMPSDLSGALDFADAGGDALLDGNRVAHLTSPQVAGTQSLTLTAQAMLDTSALTINGDDPPQGVLFEVGHEATSGAELAILRVDALSIAAGVTVTVTGNRGLVVVAASDIEVAGVLDAHAVLATPGPGGFAAGSGPGVGRPSAPSSVGGTGGGYGTAGGGSSSYEAAQTLPGGDPYGNPAVDVLFGGSGGGTDDQLHPGGAGGGVVQLTSATAVHVVVGGGVNVGGGGAPAGNEHSSGAGGGAGGSLVLQAPVIVVEGTLAANGGGGRGCAPDSHNAVDATNGQLSAVSAPGSADGGYASGGAGGALASLAATGSCSDSGCSVDGPGGGGAVGRIAILYRTSYTPAGTTSPAEHVATY